MPICNINDSKVVKEVPDIKQITDQISSVEITYKDRSDIKKSLSVLKERNIKLWFNSLWGGIDDELAVEEN